jgi:F0F1-type ATP synthase gamma subunit
MERIPAPQSSRYQQSRMSAILFGSNHGLCGRLNEKIINHALKSMMTNPGTCLLLAVGSRVAHSLERNGHAAETFFQFPGSAPLIPTTVQREQLLGRLLRQYFFIKLVRACAENHKRANLSADCQQCNQQSVILMTG